MIQNIIDDKLYLTINKNSDEFINIKKNDYMGPWSQNVTNLKIICNYNYQIYNFNLKINKNIVQEEFYFPLFKKSMNKKIFLVAIYEKNQDYKSNILYFIDNGIKDDIDYLFILNNDITFENQIPIKSNVSILKRQNDGYDFGGYCLGIQSLKHKQYDYYFFVNSSTIGPFIPSYISNSFDQIFISKFVNNVHLVSPTIIILEKSSFLLNTNLLPHYQRKIYPICQTFMFVIDSIGFELLNKYNFFDYFYKNEFLKIGQEKECLLSMIMLHNNYNIACLMPEFKNINFVNLENTHYTYENNYNPIIENQLFGRTMHPYEVIFHKSNRNLNNKTVSTLIQSKNIILEKN